MDRNKIVIYIKESISANILNNTPITTSTNEITEYK